ncbi:bifunctional diaminohydroxyphosphoribosylaminopyrimidine deaminase/5-amino-6-(5-phosphoribosylamino)uracil reductase RibD [Marinomonas agarivorans]|nr:bifunctional diaminohydroxyphosphoribosylaminopyrimidine deaminase/5-amino-6-(5-phosphoribosylamino)uracil reductase RibD [Marinomonas agarivorans]
MTALNRETDHQHWMNYAISLAKKGLYTTHPNPRVGCVLIRDNQIVGEGYHRKAGEAHAEINAIASAKGRTKGCTAYVTLEPCSHHGKTGPCSQALIDAQISTVVYGMQDPNPTVMGRGLKQLEDAGINVIGPILSDEAEALNPGFIKRMTEGLPFIRLKLAMSLDGRTAMASGESKWITGPEARLDVQRLRAQSDAIVTGVGSVIIDDPSMTVRINNHDKTVEPHTVRQPRRVVMDSSLATPPEAKILSGDGNRCVFYLPEQTSDEAKKSLEHLGVELLAGETAVDGKIDLVAAMATLADQEINEVLVETGAVLAGAFLQAGLVDEIVVYMAAKLLGSNARALFELPLETMEQAVQLHLSAMDKVGDDIKLVFTPDYIDEAD